MLIGNEPAPWPYYVKQYPGIPMEQLKQRYLEEQLQYFRQVEQMFGQASMQGGSQPVQETTTTSTTTTTTTAAPTTTTTTTAAPTTTSTTTTTTTTP